MIPVPSEIVQSVLHTRVITREGKIKWVRRSNTCSSSLSRCVAPSSITALCKRLSRQLRL